MSHNRWTFVAMPLRSGLATAGKRSTVDEQQLWAAQNTYPDLDGLVRTRPGTIRYGQRLMCPDSALAGSYSYCGMQTQIVAGLGTLQIDIDMDPEPTGEEPWYTWEVFTGDLDESSPVLYASGSGKETLLDVPLGWYSCYVEVPFGYMEDITTTYPQDGEATADSVLVFSGVLEGSAG